MNPKANLSKNLQRQLDARGWSQQELHRRSKISQGTIGRIIRQEAAADIETISSIASALGVDAWVLLFPTSDDGSGQLIAALSQISANRK